MKIYGGRVSNIIGNRKRVYRIEWGASGHRDRRDGCQHLTADGVGQQLFTYWCQLPAES